MSAISKLFNLLEMCTKNGSVNIFAYYGSTTGYAVSNTKSKYMPQHAAVPGFIVNMTLYPLSKQKSVRTYSTYMHIASPF